MIFGETMVLTPNGWREARTLKQGTILSSWNGKNWVGNRIEKIEQGQARTSLNLMCFDGVFPRVLRCTMDQLVCRKGGHYDEAEEVMAGSMVTISEGEHIFQAEASAVEMIKSTAPESAFAFHLQAKPNNMLAGGFLCRPH